MPKKQAILDNVEEYSAAELAGYIKDGIVTLQELCNMTEGDFTPKMKMEVEAILNAQPAPPSSSPLANTSLSSMSMICFCFINRSFVPYFRLHM